MVTATRTELLEELDAYRATIKILLKDSRDPAKINLLGIRFETSIRIAHELIKGSEDEDDVKELEKELAELKAKA